LALAALPAAAFDDASARAFADSVVRGRCRRTRLCHRGQARRHRLGVRPPGQLLERSAVLVGQAPGDVAPPDIGTRPLSKVRPSEKITAAGRYVTEPGRNAQGEDIVWLDYDAALSMHRVRNVPGEHRPERLRTPGTADKRISFGCINVPTRFYDRRIDPLFARSSGVVYVLPETRAPGELFGFAAGLNR
jgi:hypothetical protein